MSTTKPTRKSIVGKAHIQYRPAIRNKTQFNTGFPSERSKATTTLRTVNIGRSLAKVNQESIVVQQRLQMGIARNGTKTEHIQRKTK